MLEIVLVASSLAGVATAAILHNITKNRKRSFRSESSSHIKSQISTLKNEKDMLTATISRLHHTGEGISKNKKDELLSKYQHRLDFISDKLEKLEQAGMHSDFTPVGETIMAMMDKRLSSLDDRLNEISSKISTAKNQTVETSARETAQANAEPEKKTFRQEKQKEEKTKPVEIQPTRLRQSSEIESTQHIEKKESGMSSSQSHAKLSKTIKPMPKPRIIQDEVIKPEEKTAKGGTQFQLPSEQKARTIKGDSTSQENDLVQRADIKKEMERISKHKALPEPTKRTEKKGTADLEEDFDDNETTDDLDKIKGDIMKVLSKLDQAEVE